MDSRPTPKKTTKKMATMPAPNLDSTEYWTVSKGVANRTFTCRECKKTINKGQELVARDGRKIRLVYHTDCFSGDADPRTQPNSSYNDGRYVPAAHISDKAPQKKGAGKWSVQSYGYKGF